MAYASLVSLAKTIDNILHHVDHQSSDFLREKQQIIKSLHEHVIFLRAFFEDFPEKTSTDLEGRIRDATNEAEDIIESFMSKKIRAHYKLWDMVSSLSLGSYRNLRFHFDFEKLSQELRKVTEEIGSIAGEVMVIKNGAKPIGNGDGDGDYSTRLVLVSCTSRKDGMVGFDKDLMTIKTRLCGESSKLEIIPICGMGGIGKTTLARNAYEDPLTTEHFDILAWVTVSQDYTLRKILLGLLVSLKGVDEERRDTSIGLMEERVYKSLKGRRYLVVMDDMWSTNAWDDVRRLFPDDGNGSRVMLTTRLSDVATYATDSSSSSPLIHEMHFMDVDQSWDLLRKKVFKQENSFPSELEEIGRKIAKSCRGLPLAIVVVAGILSTVGPTRASWKNVAENVTSVVATNDEQFARILSLSYNHLPHHLRPCFLYMGGFPEDYEIKFSKLVKFLTAEGFMKLPSSGSKSYEEVAEEYLEDLVKRSLILVNKRKTNGNIKSCGLHDLVRELCVKKAEEEKFLLNIEEELFTENVNNVRRVSIIMQDWRWAIPEQNVYGSNVHTLLFFPYWCLKLFGVKEFRFLRVFDAVKIEFKKFPTELLELFHLRYLALEINRLDKKFYVPSSIFKLQNLQTLLIFSTFPDKMLYCRVHLPFEIWRMPQLRHLLFPVVDGLPYHPRANSFAALESLQTLGLVRNFQCTEGILRMIPNLRKLRLVYEGDYIGRIEWGDYYLDNLVHFLRLEKLSFNLKNYGRRIPLWGNLALPMTLKKLKLGGCLLRSRDMGIVGLLPNLEVLKLRNCTYEGCEWETNEGEFLRLKSLQIIHANLEQWIVAESSHFPRLERLMLYRCYELSEIPDVIGEIPTLELIEVSKFKNESLVESAKRIKEEQQDNGNESLQVLVLDGMSII